MGALGLKNSLLFFKIKDSIYKDKITTINFITTKGRLEEEAASYPCFLPFVQGVTTFFCVDVFDSVCRDDCRDFGFLNCCKIFYWWVGLFLFVFFPKICSVVALFKLKWQKMNGKASWVVDTHDDFAKYLFLDRDRSGLENISSTRFYCCNANHKIVDQILNQQLASASKYHKNWNSAQKNELNKIETKPNKWH